MTNVTGVTNDWTLTVATKGQRDGVVDATREKESWTLTCERDGEEIARREVVIDRGERQALGHLCGQAAADQPKKPKKPKKRRKQAGAGCRRGGDPSPRRPARRPRRRGASLVAHGRAIRARSPHRPDPRRDARGRCDHDTRRSPMLHKICGRCLRLWDDERVNHRSTCPHCGGALTTR